MKKKAIEAIPYLTVPGISRKKAVKYIGVTAWKNIGGERHIFLEVYRNKKASLQVPIVRYVATKKDWGVYFPEKGVWTSQKIESNEWYNGLAWSEENEGRGQTHQDREKIHILYSPEDLSRIKNFFKEIKVWNEARWWDYFDRNEQNIKHDREHRKYQRRQQALKQRQEDTPELPEQDVLQYADDMIFHRRHFLYYKKKGRRATVCCSACGQISSGAWKEGVSYESQFEHYIQEPRDGCLGTCPRCGQTGKYKPQGKAKWKHEEISHVFLGQKFRETGAVIRYIQVSKVYQLQLLAGEKEPEMLCASEELEGIEIARAYFVEGKKEQIDYHKHNPYSGKDFWDDCNLYGMSNISIRKARIMPETFTNLEGTVLQYSAMKEYDRAAGVGEVNAIDYARRYIATPQIEMLVKMKLFGVVKKLLKYEYGIVANVDAKRLDEFLGIRKERTKQLMENEGDIEYLNIMQIEKRLNQNWTWDQIVALKEMGADARDIGVTLQYMTIQKLINRVSKYAGCEFGTNCSSAIARLKHIAGIYFDYLGMRQTLGYDLTNTVYQQPRNLQDAHDRMTNEQNKAEQDKRLQEVARNYPNIRKNYRKLRNCYFYEDDTFLIRPARSAEEIVTEGKTLHHCVGGNNYLDKHNKQESIILMLRFKSEPEIPYVTVEIKGEKIVQWYGSHDKKPDAKNLQRWLDVYVTRLKCKRLGVMGNTEEEVMQQLLAYA